MGLVKNGYTGPKGRSLNRHRNAALEGLFFHGIRDRFPGSYFDALAILAPLELTA
jgi:hypothetical protein